jgi:hypothetical protein
MSRLRPRRPNRYQVLAALFALVLLATAAIWTNALGVGTRLEGIARRIELLVDPPPDRPVAETVRVTPRPSIVASPAIEPTSAGSPQPGATPAVAPQPTPRPLRARVDVNLFKNPGRHFASQAHKDWCAVAGTQMVMEIHGAADLSEGFQKRLAARVDEWESRRDSHNGGWGPSAMVGALEAFGVDGYEVRAYDSRGDALADAARAIQRTHAPVILLAWRGAHTWVMTGFRADADPSAFDDARITGAYILDPWYPRVSSIWGASDPPGTFQDTAEMRRNYLPWRRPEGRYPDRDGLFIAVVPTRKLNR